MRTDQTPDDVRALLEEHYPNRVFSVEEGLVWVSGMNADCGMVARRLAETLLKYDIPAGLVHDDGTHAIDNGGLQFRYGANA